MSDAKNITLKVTGKGWTVHISMEDAIVQHVGIQIMLSRIAEAVTNISALTPQSSTHGHSISLETPGMTGYSDGTMKSSSTPEPTSKKCTNTTKHS